MNDAAIRELARRAYDKEYQEKTPAGRAEMAIAIPSAFLFGGGFWGLVGGIGAAVFGVPAAPAILFGSLLAMVAGATGMLGSCIVSRDRADHALQRDLDNGTLVERFRQEVLQPAAAPSVKAAPPLADAGASASFAAAMAGPANQNAISARAPSSKTPAL